MTMLDAIATTLALMLGLSALFALAGLAAGVGMARDLCRRDARKGADT